MGRWGDWEIGRWADGNTPNAPRNIEKDLAMALRWNIFLYRIQMTLKVQFFSKTKAFTSSMATIPLLRIATKT
ncbi:MAG: hypothetical protein F6K24_39675 [Okeania sp. SIO2D1]|nr:hypothetical protein [Okeania sp. SIO2D1]